jgi:hypothetical protein
MREGDVRKKMSVEGRCLYFRDVTAILNVRSLCFHGRLVSRKVDKSPNGHSGLMILIQTTHHCFSTAATRSEEPEIVLRERIGPINESLQLRAARGNCKNICEMLTIKPEEIKWS